jgi:hypothetical protein
MLCNNRLEICFAFESFAASQNACRSRLERAASPLSSACAPTLVPSIISPRLSIVHPDKFRGPFRNLLIEFTGKLRAFTLLAGISGRILNVELWEVLQATLKKDEKL